MLGERRCENELKDTDVLREQKNWRKYFEKLDSQKVVEVGEHFVTKTAVLLEQMGV